MSERLCVYGCAWGIDPRSYPVAGSESVVKESTFSFTGAINPVNQLTSRKIQHSIFTLYFSRPLPLPAAASHLSPAAHQSQNARSRASMGFWSGGRFVAVAAFIAAFPPIFATFGKEEGLRLSLAILLLYLVRGTVKLVVEVGTRSLYRHPHAKGRRSRQDCIALLQKAVRGGTNNRPPLISPPACRVQCLSFRNFP